MATISAPANVPDHQLLQPTLAALESFVTEPGATTVKLDAGYDYQPCYDTLDSFGLDRDVTARGTQEPVHKTKRWKVERTNSWMNNFGLLRRLTECRRSLTRAFDLAEVIVTIRALIRACWNDYHWEGRPRTRRLR